MHIVSISWVRNEADVIEAFVRHHTQFLDKMVIINNASTDATSDILQSLQGEGLPIEVRHDESTIHRQGETLTALMHELHSTVHPDWILPLDADEFLTGSEDIRKAIADLPLDHVSLIPWKTYIPTKDDDQHQENTLKRIVHRRSVEQPQYYKIVIPQTFHGVSYSIPLGSHVLESELGTIPMQIVDGVFLAHFPVRTAVQIQRKITESWQRHSANPQKKEGQNYHWQSLYAELSTSIPSLKRLQEIAENYAMPASMPTEIVFDPLFV